MQVLASRASIWFVRNDGAKTLLAPCIEVSASRLICEAGRQGRAKTGGQFFLKKLVPTADMPGPNTPEGQGFVALHTDETTEIQAQYEDI